MNKTFCPLPWREISSGPTGSIRLCCSSVSGSNASIHPDGSIAKIYENVQESWNTEFFKTTRESMLRGESVPACSNCYKQEAAGNESERQEWIKKFPDLKPEHLTTTGNVLDVEQLDLRLGRLCNLQCRMCNPYSSSSWETSWKKLGPLVKQPAPNFWEKYRDDEWASNPETWKQLKIFVPNLKRVYLTGGEPFLVSENKHFLKYCIETNHASHIEIRYSTNGTIWDPELPELWSKFKKVKLHYSIDGLREVNDYIRFPSRWSALMKNLDLAIEATKLGPIEISISTTVQAYNIFQIPELIAFFRKKNLNIYLDSVYNPSYLSLGVLGPELAAIAREKLRSEINYPRVSGLIHMLNSSKHDEWSQFITFTKKLDEIHGLSVSDIIPELGI